MESKGQFSIRLKQMCSAHKNNWANCKSLTFLNLWKSHLQCLKS